MQTAIVFGASGAIGSALVDALSQDPRFAAIHAGARRLRQDARPGVIPFTFDLLDEPSIATAAAELPPQPDLVIIATGLLHDPTTAIAPEKTLKSLHPDAMARMFAINTIGPAMIARHMLPRLPRDRRAAFVALSARVGSIADNHLGGWPSYRASKAALNMLVRTFAIESARTHPRAIVAALHPGTVDSALSAPFQRGVPPGRLFTPEIAATHLLSVIDRLSPADSGGLFAWNGERLPF